MKFTDIFSLKRPMSDETQQNSVDIDDIDYSDLDSAPQRRQPKGKSLSRNRDVHRPTTTKPRAPPHRKSRRKSANTGDKAIKFNEIAKSYLKCENKLIDALRKSNKSMDEKLEFIEKKRNECRESQANILAPEEGINGGRRKRRRKTRRKKKRKSRRKSRKRKRNTKKRR